MSKKYEYYVIFFNNNFTFYTDDGYSSQDVSQAIQYTNLTVLKQDIEKLDDEYAKYATIYKVTEQREYILEKEGEDK